MGGTYIHLPDDSYLHVPDGVDMFQVKSRLSSMFPEHKPPVTPPLIRKPSVPMHEVNLMGGSSQNPDEVRPLDEQVNNLVKGAGRNLYTISSPGVAAGLIHQKAPGLLSKVPMVGPYLERTAPDIDKETLPNAALTVTTGIAGGMDAEPMEPVSRAAGAPHPEPRPLPSSSIATPARTSPPSSEFHPAMEVASLIPGKVGLATRLLKKLGVGRMPETPGELPIDYGTPEALRGQRVKEGTLEVEHPNPDAGAPFPRKTSWQGGNTDSIQVESILNRVPTSSGPGRPTPPTPETSNPGAPFPRRPSWQLLERPGAGAGTGPETGGEVIHTQPSAEASSMLKKRPSTARVPSTESVPQDEWDAGHQIDTQVEGTSKPRAYEPPSFIHRALPNRPGEINPHPRQYYPEQDISDEELGAHLKLKKKVQ